MQPRHALFPDLTTDSCPKNMNQSLQMGFSDQVNGLLVDGYIIDIKEARKTIHTRAVDAAIKTEGWVGPFQQLHLRMN